LIAVVLFTFASLVLGVRLCTSASLRCPE